jgi:hypothetical protein
MSPEWRATAPHKFVAVAVAGNDPRANRLALRQADRSVQLSPGWPFLRYLNDDRSTLFFSDTEYRFDSGQAGIGYGGLKSEGIRPIEIE